MRPERWLYTIPLRLRSLLRRDRSDHELDDELRDHITLKAEEYVSKGLTPAEARRQALLDLRGIEQTKEACRDARRVRWLQDLAQDLRFALRMLRKSPGFTAVAVLTLALGIGANTAIFSIVSAVLMRGLPFRDAGRLVALFQSPKGTAGPMGWAVSGPDVADWQRESRSFSAIAASVEDGANLTGTSAPRYLLGEKVTSNYFALFGVQASLGRIFSPHEDASTLSREVLISYSLWRTAFGGKAVIGRTVQLDDRIFTVIGVMPATFHDPRTWMNPKSDYWIALPRTDLETNRGEHMYAVFGRLKPDVPFDRAQQEMSVIAAAEAKEFPDTNKDFGIRVSPLQEVNLETSEGGYFHSVGSDILLLQFAAIFLLLLACANVVNFMLSHVVRRQTELALRGALGASGSRLARQMLTESLVLSALGGTAGVLFAVWGKTALLGLAPEGYLPPTANISLDWRVLCFAVAAVAFCGILFGLYPAIRASRQGPNERLKGAVTGAARVNPLSAARHGIQVEGRAPQRGDPWPQISIVSPGFFRAAGIPVLSGRGFVSGDTKGSPKVVLISRALARSFWPGKNPLGAHIRCGGVNDWVAVAGVVGDVRQDGLSAPSRPELYIPLGREAVQSPMYLVARSTLSPASLVREIEDAISTIDPNIPFSDVKTGPEIVQSWAANMPYQAILLASFAVMALLIAVIGVFGAMSYATARRSHEIGIRLALGAQRSDVLAVVIREGMLLVGIGLTIGVGGALALTRFLRSLLFEIQPTDLATFVAVAILLTAVALLACYIPARRAMNVDPVSALRCE